MVEADSYKLRLDILDGIPDTVYEDLHSKFFIRYAVARERAPITGKLHFHYYFETSFSDRTVRKYLQENGFKNKYSLSKVEHLSIEYLSYLVKDRTDVRFVNMPEGIEQKALEHSDRVRAEMKGRRKARSKGTREEMFAYLDTIETACEQEIAEHIVHYYVKHNKLIRGHQMKAEYETYLLRPDPLGRPNRKTWYLQTKQSLVTNMMSKPFNCPFDFRLDWNPDELKSDENKMA